MGRHLRERSIQGDITREYALKLVNSTLSTIRCSKPAA